MCDGCELRRSGQAKWNVVESPVLNALPAKYVSSPGGIVATTRGRGRENLLGYELPPVKKHFDELTIVAIRCISRC